MVENHKFMKFLRLAYLPLLYVAFATASIYLMLKSNYADYYTAFGFHIQKRALSSLLLFLAISTVLIPSVFRVKAKATKIIFSIFTVGWLFTLILPISTIIKFNRKVSAGLIERHGNTTPLMMAAYKGNLQEMKRLVENGADVNARNDVNNTALHFAAGATPIENQIYRGSPEAAAYLIEHGADLNAQNGTGITPLMDAIINDYLETVKLLIAHGADVNMVSRYNETALSMAILRAHSQFADPPSMKPFVRRYSDIAIELLNHGANPNFKDFTGHTILESAKKFHEDNLVDALRKYGAKE